MCWFLGFKKLPRALIVLSSCLMSASSTFCVLLIVTEKTEAPPSKTDSPQKFGAIGPLDSMAHWRAGRGLYFFC